MKQVVIISGKGGTGKTSVTAALADLAASEKRLVLADADVDAANLELLLQPGHTSRSAFMAGQTACIDPEVCSGCGRCQEVCRFDAVLFKEAYTIDPQMCEGCLSCLHQCPSGAIQVEEHQSGEWCRSDTEYGPLFHANLWPGEENSGKLVTNLIELARAECERSNADLLLVDGPPGIGCPVTAACREADLAIFVSEPTVSGRHDLERVLGLTRYFHLPALLVLNKANLSRKIREETLAFAQAENIELLGEIPYDERVARAIFTAQPLTRLPDQPLNNELDEIWQHLKRKIG